MSDIQTQTAHFIPDSALQSTFANFFPAGTAAGMVPIGSMSAPEFTDFVDSLAVELGLSAASLQSIVERATSVDSLSSALGLSKDELTSYINFTDSLVALGLGVDSLQLPATAGSGGAKTPVPSELWLYLVIMSMILQSQSLLQQKLGIAQTQMAIDQSRNAQISAESQKKADMAQAQQMRAEAISNIVLGAVAILTSVLSGAAAFKSFGAAEKDFAAGVKVGEVAPDRVSPTNIPTGFAQKSGSVPDAAGNVEVVRVSTPWTRGQYAAFREVLNTASQGLNGLIQGITKDAEGNIKQSEAIAKAAASYAQAIQQWFQTLIGFFQETSRGTGSEIESILQTAKQMRDAMLGSIFRGNA